MSVKLCKNILCRRGKDHQRKAIPKDGKAEHCSKACGISARGQRAYNRRKGGVTSTKCEPCGGTGRIDLSNTGA